MSYNYPQTQSHEQKEMTNKHCSHIRIKTRHLGHNTLNASSQPLSLTVSAIILLDKAETVSNQRSTHTTSCMLLSSAASSQRNAVNNNIHHSNNNSSATAVMADQCAAKCSGSTWYTVGSDSEKFTKTNTHFWKEVFLPWADLDSHLIQGSLSSVVTLIPKPAWPIYVFSQDTSYMQNVQDKLSKRKSRLFKNKSLNNSSLICWSTCSSWNTTNTTSEWFQYWSVLVKIYTVSQQKIPHNHQRYIHREP